MYRLRQICLVVLILFVAGPCAVAQTTPIPVIQTPVPADLGSAAFSHDGKLVATRGELGKYTTLWDAKTGQKVVTLSSGWAPIIDPAGSVASVDPSGPRTLVFSSDDRYVAAVDTKGSPPIVWECETGRYVAWETPTDVQAWTIGSSGELPSLLGGAKPELRVVLKIAVSTDGSKLAVAPGYAQTLDAALARLLAMQGHSIELWPLRGSQTPISFATVADKVQSLVFSHYTQWLGAASQSLNITGKYTSILVGDVRLWHVSDGAETKLKIENTRAAQNHEWSATSVAFSADDKQVVANVFTEGKLPERDCPPDEYCGDLESIPYDVRTNFFDITSGRAVNTTRLWTSDAAAESEKRGFFWLSSDGRRAIIAAQYMLTLVNTLTGREVGTFKPPKLRLYPDAHVCKGGFHPFGFAAFSNDGKQIAISDGKQLHIVDARTGSSSTGNGIYIASDPIGVWQALAGSFSPNGEKLGVATCNGSGEGELLLYNVSDLHKVGSFRAESVLTSLAFTPDGTLLFAGGYDGTVRVVETQHGSLAATLFRNLSGAWIVFTPDGLYDASADGARLLGWRLKGQIVLASELSELARPGLLSMLIAGKCPKPDTTLSTFISKAVSHSP